MPEAGAAYVLNADLDFDIKFGQAGTIEGESIVDFNVSFQSGGANSGTYYVTGRAIKVLAGGTEVVLATGNSVAYDYTHTGGIKDTRSSLNMDIPNTTIHKGESLRLNMQVYCKNFEVGKGWFASDPADKKSFYYQTVAIFTRSSTLRFFVPFRIQL